jgi:hypothetical protein
MMGRKLLPGLCVTLLLWPAAAHAYLDPATGSMLLQLLLGGVAGAAVLVKLFWRRILGFFGASEENRDQPSGS